MIIRADARSLPLVDRCVQCVVTSPPYFGLRDYGHVGQIGLEATPAAYVATLVQVFKEVRRVLQDDGTVWLNLGDSYAGSGKGGNPDEGKQATNRGSQSIGVLYGKVGETARQAAVTNVTRKTWEIGAKAKDLLGIPWRVAFALQADGWYLRSDIIWHKKNPMPESVTDRPTKAHEYLFLLAKSERYYYDAEAITEPVTGGSHARGDGVNPKSLMADHPKQKQNASYSGAINKLVDERNKRSVWSIATMAYSGAHFATMPEALVEPCILAGCPLGGLVLDPFLGSGTVGAVAERLGRRWVGTDLSYQPLSSARTAQRGIRFEAGDVA